VNTALLPDQTSPEEIEDTMTTLSELGIPVVEGGESEEEPAVAEIDHGETRGNLNHDVSRPDDPVRMYLRQMSSVALLSREGEIAIAKRIEAGREVMIGGIYESPLTAHAVIGWRDALAEGTMLLRDIIDLDAMFRGNGFGPSGAVAASAVPRPAGGADHDTDRDCRGNLVEIESSLRSEEGDGAESSISSAEIEAQLKPGVIAICDAITDIHKNLHWLQDERIVAMHKREAPSLASERRYHKLKFESIQLLRRVHLNNARIEQLMERLYELNRRLVSEEGRLLRLAENAGVNRHEFLS
jgi:RNA polymerase primary sigma factor